MTIKAQPTQTTEDFNQALETVHQSEPNIPFPNHLAELRNLANGKDKLLIEGYMHSLLKRLSLPHYHQDKITTEHFFEHLGAFAADLIKKSDPDISLRLYIGGGVVRSLLENIYKFVHERKTTTQQDHLEKQLSGTDEEKNLLAQKIRNRASILKSAEFHLQQSKIAEKQAIASPFLLGVGSDLDIYYEAQNKDGTPLSPEQKRKVADIAVQLQHFINRVADSYQLGGAQRTLKDSVLPFADVKEYHSQVSLSVKQGGSVIDTLALEIILFDSSLRAAVLKILQTNDTVQLNMIRNFFSISPDSETDLTVELLEEKIKEKIGDDPSPQKLEALLERLDHALFIDTSLSAQHKRAQYQGTLRLPEEHPTILSDYLSGFFEYLAPQTNENASAKQAIRGLRSLVSMPFLHVKDETILIAELTKILDEITQTSGLDDKAKEQFDKLVRNAHFQLGGNRPYTAKEGSALNLGLKIAEAVFKRGEGLNQKVRFLLPSFIQIMAIDKRSTDEIKRNTLHFDDLSHALMSNEEFIKNHTDNGVVYHGTSFYAGVCVLRGGFIESTEKQGAAAFGSGLYSTNNIATSLEYSGESGLILPLTIVSGEKRILNWDTAAPELKDQLAKESKDLGYGHVFEMLRDRKKYAVDIIIHQHVLIQNQAVIEQNNSIKAILEYFAAVALAQTKNTDNPALTARSLENFFNFYKLFSDIGVDVKGLPTVTLFDSYIDNWGANPTIEGLRKIVGYFKLIPNEVPSETAHDIAEGILEYAQPNLSRYEKITGGLRQKFLNTLLYCLNMLETLTDAISNAEDKSFVIQLGADLKSKVLSYLTSDTIRKIISTDINLCLYMPKELDSQIFDNFIAACNEHPNQRNYAGLYHFINALSGESLKKSALSIVNELPKKIVQQFPDILDIYNQNEPDNHKILETFVALYEKSYDLLIQNGVDENSLPAKSLLQDKLYELLTPSAIVQMMNHSADISEDIPKELLPRIYQNHFEYFKNSQNFMEIKHFLKIRSHLSDAEASATDKIISDYLKRNAEDCAKKLISLPPSEGLQSLISFSNILEAYADNFKYLPQSALLLDSIQKALTPEMILQFYSVSDDFVGNLSAELKPYFFDSLYKKTVIELDVDLLTRLEKIRQSMNTSSNIPQDQKLLDLSLQISQSLIPKLSASTGQDNQQSREDYARCMSVYRRSHYQLRLAGQDVSTSIEPVLLEWIPYLKKSEEATQLIGLLQSNSPQIYTFDFFKKYLNSLTKMRDKHNFIDEVSEHASKFIKTIDDLIYIYRTYASSSMHILYKLHNHAVAIISNQMTSIEEAVKILHHIPSVELAMSSILEDHIKSIDDLLRIQSSFSTDLRSRLWEEFNDELIAWTQSAEDFEKILKSLPNSNPDKVNYISAMVEDLQDQIPEPKATNLLSSILMNNHAELRTVPCFELNHEIMMLLYACDDDQREKVIKQIHERFSPDDLNQLNDYLNEHMQVLTNAAPDAVIRLREIVEQLNQGNHDQATGNVTPR